MIKLKFEVSNDGHQVDLKNEAGYWIAWLKRRNGKLYLMSTGAPLSNNERISLAESAARAIGETVYAS